MAMPLTRRLGLLGRRLHGVGLGLGRTNGLEIAANRLAVAERNRLAVEHGLGGLAVLVVRRPILALRLLLAFGRMGRLDLDFSLVRLAAGQAALVVATHLGRLLGQLVAAGAAAPVLAAFRLAGDFLIAISFTLAF